MRHFALFILILILSCTLISCTKKVQEEKAVEAVPVTAINPQMRDIEVYYETSSTIKSNDSRMLSFGVGGKVVELLKEEGEVFTKGETLAKIDLEYFQNDLKAAESGLALAKKSNNASNIEYKIYENELEDAVNTFADSEKNLERYKRLYEDKIITEKELEKVQLDYDSDKIKVDSARKMLKLSEGKIQTTLDSIQAAEAQRDAARKRTSDGVLIAPFEGSIFKKHMEESSMAAPGVPVYELIASGGLKIEASLPERYLTSVSAGSNVLITIPNNHCDMVPQKISIINRDIDPMTGSFGVTVDLGGIGGCVKHGMFAHLMFEVNKSSSALSVPVECVIEMSGEKYVYVVEAGKAKKRIVETGLTSKDYVEILSGLNATDRVILSGNRYVVDDTVVSIAQTGASETTSDTASEN